MEYWTWTTLAVATLIVFFQALAWKRKAKNKKLPPGPKGLPILGNLLMIGDKPHQDFQKLAQKYGPIMHLRFGLMPVIIVSSAEAAELFLKTHDLVFASRPPHEGSTYICYNQQNLTFCPYGSYWRNARKMCTLELLSNLKINSFKSMRKGELNLLIESIQEAARVGIAVDITDKVSSLSTDMSCRMVLGKKYHNDEFHDKGFEAIIREGMQVAAAFNLNDYIPPIKALDLQGLRKRMKAVALAWKIRAKIKRLPPGPRGLPIIGNLLMLGNKPHRDLQKLAQKYGPIMHLRFGLMPVIIVSSPEAAELFLRTHDLVFASRPPVEAAKYVAYNQQNVSFSPYGSYWRNARKMCTVELLNSHKINSFKSMRKEELQLLIDSIKDAARNRVAVDLSSKVSTLSSDMSCRMVLGKKYLDDEVDERKIQAVIREGMQIGAAFNLADYIPQIKSLDLQGLTKRLERIAKVFDDLLEKIVEEHVRFRDESKTKDFVDVMLGFMDSKETEYQVTRDTIKAVILDQVPPFPSETAVSIVEEELGAPVDDIFDRFDYEPIAAASLGQVHRAKLKGQEVVIKVQRPGLKDLFDIDLKNLRVIAEYLQKLDPKSDGAKRDWVAIYDECAYVLYQEIDYTKEAANAELFANNFKEMDYVKVPTIYWEYTTPQVLTMEYVPGIKINKIQALDQLGVDRKRLGRYAVESYLEQILSHGFFHADPHPGNIAVDDVNGGRLIFYDFGMMGSISSNIREGLLEAFYGVYEKDPDKVLEAMVQMGVLVPTGDMTAVRRTAQFFLNRSD
ncbi:Cytochrome P450 [Corchorus olitorius]|uniref:Cytochrome P450 n=1 Tax=Corchorus olitorius TaxID=93759 RepID=A0A1R3K649_9ROSI|nr:Cytochrome P450 [Corchorus olitorius]